MSIDVEFVGLWELKEGKEKLGKQSRSRRCGSPEVRIAGRVLKEAEISEEEEPHESVGRRVCVRVKKCESFSCGAEEKSFSSRFSPEKIRRKGFPSVMGREVVVLAGEKC